MKVKDAISKSVITVKRSTTLREILRLFSKFHIFPLVPIVEEDGKLVGIISFGNLIKVFLPPQPEILKTMPFLHNEEEDIFDTDLTDEMGDLVIAEDIMERKFITIADDTTIDKAYGIMKLSVKEEFPVVDKDGKLIGMIGMFDIIREVFRQKGVV